MSHTKQERHLETVAKNFHGPGAWAIRRPKVALLMGIILVIWGILTAITIPKESAPYIEFGIVSINTSYNGASAIDIDTLITQEIEDKVKNVSNINTFSSVSRNGISSITVEFEPGVDMTKAVGDIRSKVDQAKPSLPSEIDDDPMITEIDSSLQPFLTVTLSGPYNDVELKNWAEDLKNSLENVNNVARVDISGGADKEIAVVVNKEQVESLGISLGEIQNAIRTSHRDTPLGDFPINEIDYSMRFSGKHKNVEDVKNIVLRTVEIAGTPSVIKVSDVAEVFERGEETNAVNRFVRLQKKSDVEYGYWETWNLFFQKIGKDVLQFNPGTIILLGIIGFVLLFVFLPLSSVKNAKILRIGLLFLAGLFLLMWFGFYTPPPQYEEIPAQTFENSVQISISRKSESDIFVANEGAMKVANQFMEEKAPADLQMDFSRIMADMIIEDYWEVVISGLQSVIMVMIFIFLFVGVREGLVASLVIPMSFIVTVGVLGLLDKTLNFMTNFSMILALGILVDTAIVVVEGAHHFIRQGFKPKEAALLSLHEYRTPLISGTATTLAVFIPLFFLPGILGQYLSFIPITVSLVLVVALFISLILLPSYAAYLLPDPEKIKLKEQNPSDTKACFISVRKNIDGFISHIINVYGKILRGIIHHRKLRLGIFALAFILFIASFLVPIRFEMFPSNDGISISVSATAPEGSQKERTDEAIQDVEKALLKYEEVEMLETNISKNSGSVYAELITMNDRKAMELLTSSKLETIITEDLKKIDEKHSGIEVRVARQRGGPPSDSPVAYRLIARDKNTIDDARTLGEKLTDIMKTIPGATAVKNDIEEIPGEFRFRVDRAKALKLGVDPSGIPGTVRTALNGSTAAVITKNGKDIDVVVEFKEADVNTLDKIDTIQIPKNDGTNIKLKQVAEYGRYDALAAVRRNEGDIAFTISANNADGFSADQINQAFEKKVEEMNIDIPSGIELKAAGENEENAELFMALASGAIISILLIFLILVIQFNRFLQPLLILFTILFAQIGVTMGLYLSGSPRSLAYILGVIALAGVVVNDAIIMVDQMNRNTQKKSSSDKKKEISEKSISETHSQSEKQEEYFEKIIFSAKSRFIPVVLTTLTTSAGAIPLIFIDAFWASLSFTIIFGLMVASSLTLFVTPAMYIQFEKEKWTTGAFLGILIKIPIFLTSIAGLIFGGLNYSSLSFFVITTSLLILFIFLFVWGVLYNKDKNKGIVKF